MEYNISLPPFPGYPTSGFKNKAFENVRTTSKKYNQKNSSEEICLNEKAQRRTIHERLTDIFLEQVERKKVQIGPFTKCNYIEKLVAHEDLKYMIVSIFPNQTYFLYVKNEADDDTTFIHSEEDPSILDSIDIEEIPSSIFKWLQIGFNYLFYDYHIIVQLRKYATLVEDDKLIFSTFVLLRPHVTMCSRYIIKGQYYDLDSYQNRINPVEKESEVFFKIAGPLYLDLRNPIVSLQLIFHSEYYACPFVSNSLKDSINKRRMLQSLQSKTHSRRRQYFQECYNPPEITPCIDSSTVVSLTCIPVFFEQWKQILHSSLAKREMFIEETDDHKSKSLVEIFYFEIKMGEKNDSSTFEDKQTYQIEVYIQNNVFYTHLKNQNYIYSPHDSIPLNNVGNMQNLDKYIYSVAENLSDKFRRDMVIHHKNVVEKQKRNIFFCGCSENKANFKSYNTNSESSRSFGSKSGINETSEGGNGGQSVTETYFTHMQASDGV